MITLKGKALLLENLKNNFTGKDIDPISYMAVGMGKIPPSEFDTSLTNEKSRTDVNIEVDLTNSCIITKAKFDARTVKGSISEVGLFTKKGVLVSRDIVKDRFVISDGVMEVTYKLIISHDLCITDWRIADNGLFVTDMSVPIRGIYEDNGNGYERLDDLQSVMKRTSSYYHDLVAGKLYINRSKNYKDSDDIYVSFDQAVRKIDSKIPAEDIDVPLVVPTPPQKKDTAKSENIHTLREWIDNCKTGDVLVFKEEEVNDDALLTIKNGCFLEGKTPGGTILNVRGIVIPPSKNKIFLGLKSIKIRGEYFEDTVFYNNSNHSIFIGTEEFNSIETKPLGTYNIQINGPHDIHQDEITTFIVEDIGELDIPDGVQVSFEIEGKNVGFSKFKDGEASFSYNSDQLGRRTLIAKVVVDDMSLKDKFAFEVIPSDYIITIPSAFDNDAALVDAIQELNNLIGLTEVKKHISRIMAALILNKRRKELGSKREIRISKNFVFTGNPGTGKTTVAKLYGKIFYHLHLLSQGNFHIHSRSSLIGTYQGTTAVKTEKAMDEAMTDVMFIDEAYNLCHSDKDDYGLECLGSIVGKMGDDGVDDRVVIFAGYDKEIRTMMKYNPGLMSRFNTFINFRDYNARELMSIFEKRAKTEEIIFDNETSRIVLDHFKEKTKNLEKGFGNARYVNQLFTIAAEIMTERIILSDQPITKEPLRLIADDVKEALRLLKMHEGE